MSYKATWRSLGWFKPLLLEVLIILPHTPSFVKDVVLKIKNQDHHYFVGLNQLISVYTLLRLYLLIKLISRFSKFQEQSNLKIR